MDEKLKILVQEELVRYQGRLHELLLCITAAPQCVDDLLQRTNVEILRNAQKRNSSLPAWPWLQRFAVNVVRNWRRERRERVFFDTAMLERLAEGIAEPAENARGEKFDHLKLCLAELPEGHRTLLEERYIDETPLAKLSSRLRISAQSLSKLLYRIRETVRKCILKKEKQAEFAQAMSEKDRFLCNLERILDGETDGKLRAEFAAQLEDAGLRGLYFRQIAFISRFLRHKKVRRAKPGFAHMRVVAASIAAACIAFCLYAFTQRGATLDKQEKTMKTPLVFALAAGLSGADASYQFIETGDPVAASTEKSHSQMSPVATLNTGTLSAVSPGGQCEARFRTSALSPVRSLNSTQFKGTVVVLI